MDVTLLFALFGSVTGALSLVGLVLVLGMYKERIDRHERWFNLLVEESLMRAWKSGMVERQSPFKSKPETIEALPAGVREACRKIAAKCAPSCPPWRVADRLVAELENGVLDQLCQASGLTPLEAMGALTVYTLELLTSPDPTKP